VAGLRKWPRALIGLSVGLYAASQCWPETVALPEPFRTACYFNPAAWQVLFVAGLAMGTRWSNEGGRLSPRSRLVLALAALVVVEAMFAWKLFGGGDAGGWGRKSNLAPLRLAHLAGLAVVVWTALDAAPGLATSPALAPIRACGRSPLTVFCVGILLSAAGYLWLATIDAGPVSQVGVTVTAIAGCLSVAARSRVEAPRTVVTHAG
jgi:hypothetical protein